MFGVREDGGAHVGGEAQIWVCGAGRTGADEVDVVGEIGAIWGGELLNLGYRMGAISISRSRRDLGRRNALNEGIQGTS